MSITDEQLRREAQRLLLAEILREQAQTPAQPLTDPAQRRAAQQRTIAQNLGPAHKPSHSHSHSAMRRGWMPKAGNFLNGSGYSMPKISAVPSPQPHRSSTPQRTTG